ncbi:glycosyltransferase [Microbacterium aurum]
MIAPTADRESTGEARLTFEWVSHLAARHEVTVLTYRQRRGRSLSAQLPHVDIVEWLEPPLIGRHERFNAMLNPGYFPFRRHARAWIRRAIRRGERFDVAHQLAPVSLRYPSPLADTGIPYVIGPVGGSLSSPPAFAAEEGGAPWFTGLRRWDVARLRFDPALRHSFSRAGAVIGIADYVRDLLAEVPIRRFVSMSDVGIESLPVPAVPSDRTTAVRFLFVGRLIRTKGLRDAIRALAHLPGGAATLDVVGEGHDRAECELLVRTLGLGEQVRFHGHVAHTQVAVHYRNSDVFLFPSYREAGGIVVVEAMSYGLPLIVADRGGPAASVDDNCGIRVEPRDPDQYARDLAAAMSTLAADPALRAALGAAARARTAELSLWDRRVEAIELLYSEVISADVT